MHTLIENLSIYAERKGTVFHGINLDKNFVDNALALKHYRHR
jgi:hypothetical protein